MSLSGVLLIRFSWNTSEFEEKRAEKRAEQMDDPEAIWVGKEAA
jgi:hypothetical protein